MSKCVGCGITLQSTNPQADGYTQDIKFKLCNRCFTIKYYGQDKLINKTNADYLKILDDIRDNDIVVYVSSLLTLNLDFINKFKHVLLVLTKRDVLPKSVKDGKIINYVKKKYDNILDVMVVSAYKKYNLDGLYQKLLKYKDKNIYFVGLTNSGKSTLINSLVKSYSDMEEEITVSNYPATTLGVLDIDLGGLKIKDTPGMVLTDSIVNKLDSKGIKKINSKKEIKPVTIQITGTGAILIDEYIRIEYETVASSMTLYVSNNLDVQNISLKNPRLLNTNERELLIPDKYDLVIEDIGFIKFTHECKIKICDKYKAYVYVRDNMI